MPMPRLPATINHCNMHPTSRCNHSTRHGNGLQKMQEKMDVGCLQCPIFHHHFIIQILGRLVRSLVCLGFLMHPALDFYRKKSTSASAPGPPCWWRNGAPLGCRPDKIYSPQGLLSLYWKAIHKLRLCWKATTKNPRTVEPAYLHFAIF